MIGYYDRNGTRLPDDWLNIAVHGRKYLDSNTTDHRIARSKVGDITVSTVWLGLDHAVAGGPPLIFETMTFGEPWGYELCRYSTEEAAMRGHLNALDRLRTGRPPFDHPEVES